MRNIYVVTQFMSSSLNRHIAKTYQMDSFTRGFVGLLAATQTLGGDGHEDWFQGTADAVRKCLIMANVTQYRRVVILSGDQLYKMDYRDMLKTHEENNAKITVGVLPVEENKVSDFGIMRINETGRITEFTEKPKDNQTIQYLKIDDTFVAQKGVDDPGKRWLASMGIYIFDTDILLRVLEDRSKIDFGKDIIPAALKEYKTMAHLFQGYWEDIGTIKAFFDANIDLGREKPNFDFFGSEDEKIFSLPRNLMATRYQGAKIHESIISEGCFFGKDTVINNSVVGIRSVIEKGARLTNTIMMGCDFYDRSVADSHLPRPGVGAGANIKNAILDKNVRIGEGVQLINKNAVLHEDGENYFIREGIIIIPKNTNLPPNLII